MRSEAEEEHGRSIINTLSQRYGFLQLESPTRMLIVGNCSGWDATEIPAVIGILSRT